MTSFSALLFNVLLLISLILIANEIIEQTQKDKRTSKFYDDTENLIMLNTYLTLGWSLAFVNKVEFINRRKKDFYYLVHLEKEDKITKFELYPTTSFTKFIEDNNIPINLPNNK